MGKSSSKNPKINKNHNKLKMFKIGISVGRNDLNLEGHFQMGFSSKGAVTRCNFLRNLSHNCHNWSCHVACSKQHLNSLQGIYNSKDMSWVKNAIFVYNNLTEVNITQLLIQSPNLQRMDLIHNPYKIHHWSGPGNNPQRLSLSN